MIRGKYFADYLVYSRILKDKIEIKDFKVDSRVLGQGDAFLAIYGGNSFVEEALNNGASFVVCEREDLKDRDRVHVVKDSVKFLQEFSKYYLNRINPNVFAITGSNGKTSVKDILYTILSSKEKGKKTEGNFNNHIGLPLTILNLEEDDKFIVLEMGMSGFGEIDTLAKIAEPNYGIITNIGDSHLEQLKNRENVHKAKRELVQYVQKKLVVSGDDCYLRGENALKVGFNRECDFRIYDFLENELGISFKFEYENKEYNIKSNLNGKHNSINILLALAVAVESGIKIEDVIDCVESLKISKMRFEKIEKNGILYINDAYNASPVSMKAALESFNGIYNEKYKVAVLGDMLELGEGSKEFHEDIGEYIFDMKIDNIFLYGKEMKCLYDKYKNKNVRYFDSKDKIVEEIKKIEKDKVVLLKGSRGMRLEDIMK